MVISFHDCIDCQMHKYKNKNYHSQNFPGFWTIVFVKIQKIRYSLVLEEIIKSM